MADTKTNNILLVAAEASSCMYARLFMEAWKVQNPRTHFFGVGDQEMKSLGMECMGLAEDLAVVGLQEVLSHWKWIRSSFLNIVKAASEKKPDFALLLDYPGFNLRLAPKLKELGIPVVYYISPQLWAWKERRVKIIKKFVDDMMVVFPFEVDFYKKHQVQAHFVGHPLVEVVNREKETFSSSSSLKPVLGLMPGSRKSEIKHHLEVQWSAAKMLRKHCEVDIRFLVAPTLEVDFLKKQIQDLPDHVEFLKDPPTVMIQKCDLILSASGTATLQAALCEKPMVVMYRMNPLSAFFAKFFFGTYGLLLHCESDRRQASGA